MNQADVRHLVEAAIHHVAPEADLSSVDTAVDLRDELDIDSMDFLNLVDELHDRTGVDIPERDYPSVSSIDGCIAYLTASAAPHSWRHDRRG
jgi:acyl carrier protein